MTTHIVCFLIVVAVVSKLVRRPEVSTARAPRRADRGRRRQDLLDRLTEEVTPEGTVSYDYDDAGRRTSMTVAGQTAVTYSYDNADRLTGVTQGTAAVTIGYDNADRRTSLTLPNGILVEYGYDDDSRLTGLTYKQGSTTLGDLSYTYDAAGQRTAVGGTWARTSLPAALASATYDDANQIATWGATSFTYDDNGNLTSDGVRSFTWDSRNQLVLLTGPVPASFAYDGFGRRRSKTVASTTTGFLYDVLNPVQELSGGSVVANLLSGLDIDEYFTRTDSLGVRNYLTDALVSTVALADVSAVVQTEYTYEPFGTVSVTGGSTSNTIAFTGREADGTGLYYYRARYYDSGRERFLAEDPIGFAGLDLNLYRYVHSSPTNARDPLGLCPPCAAAGTATAGAVAGVADWLLAAAAAAAQAAAMSNMNEGSAVPGSRTIPKPRKPRCGCTCICRADADATMRGNLKLGWPTFAFGSATASNCVKASKEAKRNATRNLGMKPKHIPCNCQGS